jgi:DNA-binding transcriptional LysR family regulator
MSLYPYKVFQSIVKQGSFANAAQALGVTPSSVSHTISKLEEELGFPLFVRSRGKSTLTESGKILLPSILNYINTENKLEQACAEINGLERGSVSIGAFNSVTMSWLPSIIKQYKQAYPHIEIHVKQGGYSVILNDVNNGLLDIGFVTRDTAPNREMIPLCKDPLLCITPKSYIPQNVTYVTRDEIRDMPIALQGGGSEADTIAFLKEIDVAVMPNIQISDDSSLVSIVESGISMAIMPSLLFKQKPENVNLYPIDPPAYRTIGLITIQKQFISPATQKMKDMILSFIKENGIMNL